MESLLIGLLLLDKAMSARYIALPEQLDEVHDILGSDYVVTLSDLRDEK